MTRRGERFTDDEIARIRSLAESGWTDVEIAVDLGRTSPNTIGNVRRREGVASGQMRRYTSEEDAAIRELVAAGRSSREIAKAVGRSELAIYGRRRTEWIDEPRHGPRQIAAEARRDAHIAMLRERRAARRAAEREGVEA